MRFQTHAIPCDSVLARAERGITTCARCEQETLALGHGDPLCGFTAAPFDAYVECLGDDVFQSCQDCGQDLVCPSDEGLGAGSYCFAWGK